MDWDLRAKQSLGRETPAILLTGHFMRGDLEELQAQGVSAWLPKRLNLEQLAQAIAGVLSGQLRGELVC